VQVGTTVGSHFGQGLNKKQINWTVFSPTNSHDENLNVGFVHVRAEAQVAETGRELAAALDGHWHKDVGQQVQVQILQQRAQNPVQQLDQRVGVPHAVVVAGTCPERMN